MPRGNENAHGYTQIYIDPLGYHEESTPIELIQCGSGWKSKNNACYAPEAGRGAYPGRGIG